VFMALSSLEFSSESTLARKREMVEAATGNARFFSRSGPHPLAVIARAACGIASELDLLLEGVAPLQSAGPNEVSFLDNRRYTSALEQTLAGAVIVHPDMQAQVPAATVPILTTEPYAGWARVAALFHPVPPVSPGIHPSAIVAEGAHVDPSAEVGPLSVIETGAEIGPGCRIGPCAVIGSGVIVGRDCRIGAHVSLSYALLGARVYVYPGARIGQEGFGFASTKAGFLTVPQLGRVILEDDVEVGANTTIDRGSARDTVIGAGSRLDNLVQIGHNVILGRCCVIVAQVGISGSTVLEDFVRVGGQAAMAGHLRIGRGAQIGAQAGVISDMPSGATVLGSPAQPKQEFFRQVVTLKRMARRQK
jgi:UDP-3-O-[3-hydroxymyristoyl] glucosamine N-acyltransferase